MKVWALASLYITLAFLLASAVILAATPPVDRNPDGF
jgi:hypothetical protein